jgi:hypothetical protein
MIHEASLTRDADASLTASHCLGTSVSILEHPDYPGADNIHITYDGLGAQYSREQLAIIGRTLAPEAVGAKIVEAAVTCIQINMAGVYQFRSTTV